MGEERDIVGELAAQATCIYAVVDEAIAEQVSELSLRAGNEILRLRSQSLKAKEAGEAGEKLVEAAEQARDDLRRIADHDPGAPWLHCDDFRLGLKSAVSCARNALHEIEAALSAFTAAKERE